MYKNKNKLVLLCFILSGVCMAESTHKSDQEIEIERLVNKILKDSHQAGALKAEEIAKVKSLVKLKLAKNKIPIKETVEDTRKKSNALSDLLLASPENSKAVKGKIDTYNKIVLKENSKYSFSSGANSEENTSIFEESLTSESEIRKKEMRHVTVKSGDTLSGIANSVYGTILKYKKIYKANDDILRNPNKIFVGQKLRVPK
jgi:nucleoid-associated protein YgaU